MLGYDACMMRGWEMGSNNKMERSSTGDGQTTNILLGLEIKQNNDGLQQQVASILLLLLLLLLGLSYSIVVWILYHLLLLVLSCFILTTTVKQTKKLNR